MYDPRVNRWRNTNPMGGPRAYGAAVTVNGSVYASGGLKAGVSGPLLPAVGPQGCCPEACLAGVAVLAVPLSQLNSAAPPGMCPA